MIEFGLLLTAATELLEHMISLGSFYMSPGRIYILLLAYLAAIHLMMSGRSVQTGLAARKYLLAAGALLLISLVSVTQSDDTLYSLKRVLNATSVYMLPLVVYFYLRVSSNRIPALTLLRKSGFAIVCTGVFLSIFGIFQEFTGVLQLSREVRVLGGIPFTRINGLHYDGNFFAYFLVFPLWLALAGDFSTNGLKTTFQRLLVIAPMALALALTGSRGGQMMFAALVFSYLVQLIFQKRPRLVMLIELPIVVLVPVGLLLFSYFGFERIYHSVATVDTGNESGYSRVLAWYSGFQLYLESPLLGVGPGNFVTQNKGMFLPLNYVAPWVAAKISVLAGHSNVLEILVESGPVALIAYFAMQFAVYRRLLVGSTVSGASGLSVYRNLFFAAAVGNIFISYAPLFLMVLTGALLYIVDASESESTYAPAEPVVGNLNPEGSAA